eukprot:8805947-Karenia_brevis.AAC.1
MPSLPTRTSPVTARYGLGALATPDLFVVALDTKGVRCGLSMASRAGKNSRLGLGWPFCYLCITP